MPTEKSNYDTIIIILASLLLFTLNIGRHDFIGFETRFVVFAKHMLQYGPSFFPVSYQHPYGDYTALSTFLIFLCSIPFHQVTLFSAMLPTSLAASFTLYFTYKIGALYQRRLGLFAVLFCLLSYSFMQQARTISMDMFVALATTASFYWLLQYQITQHKQYCYAIALALIFSFSLRGPIGFIIPAAVINAHLLFERRYKTFMISAVSCLLLLLTLVSCLLLIAYLSHGIDFVHGVLAGQGLGRLHNKGPGSFFYFTNSLSTYALSFPFALILIVSQSHYLIKNSPKLSQQKLSLYAHLLLWLAVILIGMSIPSDKKTRYILATTPAIALLLAHLFILPDLPNIARKLQKFMLGLCLSLPSLVLLTLIILSLLQYRLPIPLKLPIGFCCILFFALSYTQYRIYRQQSLTLTHKHFGYLLTAALTLVLTQILLVDPISNQLAASSPFINKINTVFPETRQIVFYQIGPNDIDTAFVANNPKSVSYRFTNNIMKLDGLSNNSVLIMRESAIKKLAAYHIDKQQLISGLIAHKPCYAVKLAN